MLGPATAATEHKDGIDRRRGHIMTSRLGNSPVFVSLRILVYRFLRWRHWFRRETRQQRLRCSYLHRTIMVRPVVNWCRCVSVPTTDVCGMDSGDCVDSGCDGFRQLFLFTARARSVIMTALQSSDSNLYVQLSSPLLLLPRLVVQAVVEGMYVLL